MSDEVDESVYLMAPVKIHKSIGNLKQSEIVVHRPRRPVPETSFYSHIFFLSNIHLGIFSTMSHNTRTQCGLKVGSINVFELVRAVDNSQAEVGQVYPVI